MDDDDIKKSMELARNYATLFSLDPETKVAAVLLHPKSKHVLSIGCNNLCEGLSDNSERWCRPAKYHWVVHAEVNAVSHAARAGVSTEGAVCVVTLFPCVN